MAGSPLPLLPGTKQDITPAAPVPGCEAGRVRLREWLAVAGLALVVLPFLTVNLGDFPTLSGWDEGIYLQFASGLARDGEYGTRNGGAIQRMMPPSGTGPALVVPVALALKLAGSSLVAARLVVVAFLLIALGAAYLLLRETGGLTAAIAGSILLLAAGAPAFGTLWLGRQVVGEIPGLAFTLLGLWTWTRSWRRRSGWLIAAAVLMALATVAKHQLIWILCPSVALLWVLDRLYYRQLRWFEPLVPIAGMLAGYGLWFLVTLWIIGPGERADYVATQWAVTAAVFLNGGLERCDRNLRFLYRTGQWAPALVALAYCVYRSRARTLAGLRVLVLPLLACVLFLSYLRLGLPWPRYVYSPLAVSALCVALLLGDVAGWVGRRWRPLAGAVVLALAVGLLAGPRLVADARRILTTHDRSATRFAERLDDQVPAGTPVLSWEWELEFFSSRLFVHPPFRLFPAMVDEIYSRRADPILRQPRIPPGIDYVIVGPFATETRLFDDDLTGRAFRPIVVEGPYTLHRLER